MGRTRTRSRLPVFLTFGTLILGLIQHAYAAEPQTDAAAVPASPSPAPPRAATVMPVLPMIMPGCPKGGVLDSKTFREFPGRSWSTMSLEQQATHPINLVFLNLAGVPSTVRQGQFTPCLESWGIKKSSIKRIKKDYRVLPFPAMTTEVLVMRSSRDVFVVFRATDDDWVADFTCLYTDDLRDRLNAPKTQFTKKVHLHKGFWTAYKAVDGQLMTEIKAQVLRIKATNPFSSPQVWFVGHSLGGALGSIAALRLTLDPLFFGKVGGVVTYGMPRVGDEAWQALYNAKLMNVTVRFENFRDVFAALPGKSQVCPGISGNRVYSFRHVGRAVQLCPNFATGMEQFIFYPNGTEGECKETEGQRPSIATHLIGAYFDGWRRAYASKHGVPAGILLSTSLHVRSVMCAQCAVAVKPYPLPTNKAARNDGVVTCVNTRSCTDKFVFGLVSWSGLRFTSLFRPDASCEPLTMTCQVPVPGLQTVTNAISNLAPDISLMGMVEAAESLWQNGTESVKQQLMEFISAANSQLSDNSTDSSEVITAAVNVANSAVPKVTGVGNTTQPKALTGLKTTSNSTTKGGAAAGVKGNSTAATGKKPEGQSQGKSSNSSASAVKAPAS